MSTNDFTDGYKKKIDSMQTLYRFKGTIETINELSTIEDRNIGDVYKCKENLNNYVWNGQEWINAGQDVDYSEILNKLENYQEDTNNKIESLSKTYKNSNIVGPTIEGFGKIHKLYGKTEETGEGEKSPSNPHELKCVADDVNLLDISKFLAGIKNGVTATLDRDIITFNGTCTADNTVFIINPLDKFIKNINNKTTIFVEYLGGSIQNATDVTAAVLTTSDWSPYTLAQLKNENSVSVSNITTNDIFTIFQIRIDNNVVLNNYKIRIKVSQSTKAIYSKYGEGSIKITSTDGTNTSNKVISCKPLCCLKDSEGNILAQDYIDFDRQKIHRECEHIILNGTEEWSKSSATDFDRFILYTAYDISDVSSAISNMLKHNKGTDWLSNEFRLDNYQNGHRIIVTMGTYGSLTLEQFKAKLAQDNLIIIAQRDTSIEEDIDITNSIVQYQNETTISNSDNAEMEIELTNNKAISSINENISILQKINEKVLTLSKFIEPKLLQFNDCISINTNVVDNIQNYSVQKIGNICTINMLGTLKSSTVTNSDTTLFSFKPKYRPVHDLFTDNIMSIGNISVWHQKQCVPAFMGTELNFKHSVEGSYFSFHLSYIISSVE